jgi:glycosyltransferase involved in cell wall biosynthesis
MKQRIVHIINSFEYGGAEAMLCNLVLRSDRQRFEPHVVSLIDDLTVAGPLIEAGVPLVTMGFRPGLPDPWAMVRLVRHLRRLRPSVVQTWMDHSNLIGGLAGSLVRGARVVWGVHHCDHALSKRSTRLTVAACAKLSRRVPSRVVCCSQHARDLYIARGFAAEKMTFIPNGFDTTRFSPDPQARREVRRELGLTNDVVLIGLVARYDPLKDHANFLHAAAMLRATHPHVRFVLCGREVDASNGELMRMIGELGLGEACHLLGPRRDMQRIYAAIDLLASSSVMEAFPLALGEAMACGTVCVATDVGDSALIVGETGRIVPPRAPGALASAWREMLSLPAGERARLSASARRRVCEMFELDAVTRRYEALYAEVLADREPAPRAPAWTVQERPL